MLWCNKYKGEKPTAILTVYDPTKLSDREKDDILNWLDIQKVEITNSDNIAEKFQAKLWVGNNKNRR